MEQQALKSFLRLLLGIIGGLLAGKGWDMGLDDAQLEVIAGAIAAILGSVLWTTKVNQDTVRVPKDVIRRLE